LSGAHQPVLLDEALELLLGAAYGADGLWVDGTFGRGGHSRALLARLPPDARLLLLDRDLTAIAEAERLAASDPRVICRHLPFSALDALAAEFGPARAILLDLGVSSPQLDDPQRGFSFRHDGPLDMRMDRSSGQTAADWLNAADVDELSRVLRDFGEERHARRIARAIVAARPLRSTAELADVVSAAQPRRTPGKHGATRVFQAVRIQVNDELGELARGLEAAFAALAPGGRLVVISFHSLEDRLVKRYFRGLCQPPPLPRRLPVADDRRRAPARALPGPLRPNAAEVDANPRARSALLRAVERAA